VAASSGLMTPSKSAVEEFSDRVKSIFTPSPAPAPSEELTRQHV